MSRHFRTEDPVDGRQHCPCCGSTREWSRTAGRYKAWSDGPDCTGSVAGRILAALERLGGPKIYPRPDGGIVNTNTNVRRIPDELQAELIEHSAEIHKLLSADRDAFELSRPGNRPQ